LAYEQILKLTRSGNAIHWESKSLVIL
jgi:hypothetical protein